MNTELVDITNPLNLEDSKLIDKFIQGSNQLLSSYALRLESAGAVPQLMSRTGEVIAALYAQNQPRSAIVKQSSPFFEQIQMALLEQEYICSGASKRSGFIEYRYYNAPAGYRVWYTEPGILWKKWWPSERFQNKQRFNMDILVNIKNNWYPVRNITVHAGKFTIETIAGKLLCNRDESVLWLAQRIETDPPQPAATTQTPEREVVTEMVAPPAPPAPAPSIDRLTQQLAELEQSYREMEQKYCQSEQRAQIAEQRLEIIYRYMRREGISLQDIYRA
jgi:hypothetical protein